MTDCSASVRICASWVRVLLAKYSGVWGPRSNHAASSSANIAAAAGEIGTDLTPSNEERN